MKAPREHKVMAQAARWYMRQGHPVLPLARNGKVPLPSCVPNGLKDATTTLVEVGRWEKKGWDGNLAMRMDGLVCLDLDGPEGVQSLKNLQLVTGLGKLPKTRTQKSARGWHAVFTPPEGVIISQSTARIGTPPGIDIRAGDRGYIVVAPSIHKSGHVYKWLNWSAGFAPLPDIWAEQLTEPNYPVRPMKLMTLRDGVEGSAWGLTALKREVERIVGADLGARNGTLVSAAYSIGRIVGGGNLLEDVAIEAVCEAGCASGLSQWEVKRTVTGAIGRGIQNPRGPAPKA